jgi:hypothetical protein
MTRYACFAIILISTGLLNSSVGAVTAARCEDRFANCVGTCNNPGGGVTDNKCMHGCDRRVTSCMVRSYNAAGRCSHSRAGTWHCL